MFGGERNGYRKRSSPERAARDERAPQAAQAMIVGLWYSSLSFWRVLASRKGLGKPFTVSTLREGVGLRLKKM